MSTRVVDRVDDWGGRSFSGGYPALHDLADREFSGVVRAGGAELYMTKGVVVGVRQGSIEDLADAQGTAFEAPSAALPLLAVMQERDGEVRDEFYSEKTSIAEVDRTLSEGGFTGYIELSENVLSGDYYLVYQAGRSMSVGFVGESARLIDGDEAFETADDEVGIYKVHAVDVETTEIPERGRASGAATGRDETDRTGAAGTDTTAGADTSTGADTTAGADATAGTGSRRESGAGQEDEASEPSAREPDGRDSAGHSGSRQPTEEPAAEGTSTGASSDARRAESDAAETGEDRQRSGSADRHRDDSAAEEGRDGRGADSRESGTGDAGHSDPTATGSESRERAGGSRPADSPAQPEAASEPDGPADWDQETARGRAGQGSGPTGAEEALDLEQRAIPSLDPDLTAHSNGSTAGSVPDSPEQPRARDAGEAASRQPESDRGGPEQHPSQPQEQPAEQDPGTEAAPQPRETTQRPGESPSAPTVDPERVETLESELEEREAEIRRLEDDLASATAERNDLREELAAVREERDELSAEVERLEGELARLEEELGAATDAERRITGEEALAGTDVFVRYHSKGDATLEKAHGSSTRKEEVNDNLRLEKHTQFETEAVAVGSQSYSEYIEGTVEYQFVEWLVRQLLFEIRETGHEKELKTLYDVLPAVDRAELAGVVDVVYSADGQETRSEEAFDIILRDRMGNPLLVANLNDSREAATEPMMEDLITAAERVGQTAQQFAGAFLVTRSFFDPGALEVAEGATRGGLLSRDKRKSFVNISRKRGYHLCLVEARNENFHLAVPEL